MKRMIASCLIVFLIGAFCMAVVYGNGNIDPGTLSPDEETACAEKELEDVLEYRYKLDLPLCEDPDGFVSLVREYSFTGISEPNLEILSLPTLSVRFETRFDGTEAILCGSVTFV